MHLSLNQKRMLKVCGCACGMYSFTTLRKRAARLFEATFYYIITYILYVIVILILYLFQETGIFLMFKKEG